MTATSDIGNADSRPAASMRGPPTPTKLTSPPHCARSASISLAPSASPEGSPATMAIFNSRRPAVDEQSGVARGLEEAGAVGDQHLAGGQREAGELGAPGGGDGAGADGGQVDPHILAPLGGLHEHADPAFQPQPAVGAQIGDAGQHVVGALGRFDGERALARDDGALADIERRHGRQQSRAQGDVGERLVARRRPDDLAALREQSRREIQGADDAEALDLEQAGDGAQQRVVAAAEQFGDFAGALDRAPVGQEVAEIAGGSPGQGS